jgi:DNA (cytosine-5)-methyltransferase 1
VTTHSEILLKIYAAALEKAFEDNADFDSIDAEIKEHVGYIVSRSESNKGMVSVLTTLLVHKLVAPEQDIRYHQAGMDGGFAGRGIDKYHVTPFMKKVSFPAMAESGWLTRSLEQAHPYTLYYPGKITPREAKVAFLTIIDKVQEDSINADDVLLYFFVLLIRQRDKMKIELAKPHRLPINAIISLLRKHFEAKYSSHGASRLPTLAVYAAYRCMMPQVLRYADKVLSPLENHNSPDAQSGRIGDIDVNNADGSTFEGVEVKHQIVITRGLVADAYEKFKSHGTDRYYLLTTANMDNADWESINAEIKRLANIHGCQVIVNGVYTTLKYYLRLLKDPAEFIDCYVECMKSDESIKFQHKTMWNDIVSGNT